MKKLLFLILLSISFQSFADWDVLSKEDEFTGEILKYGVYVKDQERKVILSCDPEGPIKWPLSIFFSVDIDLGDNRENFMDYKFETNEGGIVEYNIDGNFGKIAVITINNSVLYNFSTAQSSYELRKSLYETFTVNDFVENKPVDLVPLMKKGNVMRAKFHGLNYHQATAVIDLKGFTSVYNKVKKQCILNGELKVSV